MILHRASNFVYIQDFLFYFFCLSVTPGIVHCSTVVAFYNTLFCPLIISINYGVGKIGSKSVIAVVISAILKGSLIFFSPQEKLY